MNCKNCGKKLTGKENFCRICGTPVEHEEDNNELTDNIDVSKIEIAKKENIPEDDTMELKANTKKSSSELSAMMELTSVENKDEEPVKEEKKEDIEESKPEEIEKLDEIQKTEELLLEEKDSETKIKEILEEMNPETEEFKEEKKEDFTEDSEKETEQIEDEVKEEKQEVIEEPKEEDTINSDEIVIDENQEPTAVIPEDLISKFEKEKEEQSERIDEDKKQDSEEEIKDEIKEGEKEESSIVIEKEEPIDEKKSKIEESIISIVDDKTIPLEFDKTETFNKPIIPNDDEYNMNKKDSKTVVFMILFILCLGVIGYLVFMNFSSSNKVDDMKKENEKLSNKVEELSKKDKKETKDETTNNSIVKYNGYSIDLNGYTYNFSNNNLVVNNNTYSIGIQIKNNLKYTSIKDSKDDYRNLFNSVQSYGTKVIEEKEYVVFEFKDATDNYLAAYTSLSDEDSVAYIINFKDKEIDYDVLLATNKITTNSKVDSLSEQYDIELFEK